MDLGDAKCLRDIEQYGCHVIHVLEDGEVPSFAYSVGITKSSNAAELIVIGLKQRLAHLIINEYCRRVRAGERFNVGARYAGFLEGFECEVRRVDLSHYRNYLGWCRWLYAGNNFTTVQLVYPTTEGTWPWDPAASQWFRAQQPLLDVAVAAT